MKDDESQNSRMEDHGLAPADDRAETQEPEVNHSRRNLARAGVTAPILMTLASRPVFGNPVNGQCLSNIMSGNLSTQNNGNCSLGAGPGSLGWKQPPSDFAFILGVTSDEAWGSIGYGSATDAWGTLNPLADGTDCLNHYTGGVLLSATLLSGLGGGSLNGKTLREILCDDTVAINIKYCVAAWLSAVFSNSTAAASIGYKYIVREGDIRNFCLNNVYPAGFISLEEFLLYTFDSSTI